MQLARNRRKFISSEYVRVYVRSPEERCKNIRISIDILWQLFRIFTKLLSYIFVFVNRRNNEARAMWARGSLFRKFTNTNLYGTGSVKTWKACHTISMDTRIFFSRGCLSSVSVQSTQQTTQFARFPLAVRRRRNRRLCTTLGRRGRSTAEYLEDGVVVLLFRDATRRQSVVGAR